MSIRRQHRAIPLLGQGGRGTGRNLLLRAAREFEACRAYPPLILATQHTAGHSAFSPAPEETV